MVEPAGAPIDALLTERLASEPIPSSARHVALVAQPLLTPSLPSTSPSIHTKSAVSLQEPKRKQEEPGGSAVASEPGATSVLGPKPQQKQGWGSWLWSGAKHVGASLGYVARGAGSVVVTGASWALSAVRSPELSSPQEEQKEALSPPPPSKGNEAPHDTEAGPELSKGSGEEEQLEGIARLFEQVDASLQEGVSASSLPIPLESQVSERGLLSRIGSSTYSAVSTAVGGVRTACSAIGSAASTGTQIVATGLGYAWQGVSAVASAGTKAVLPTVVRPAVQALIDGVAHKNPILVQETEAALAATVDGARVVDTFRALAPPLTSMIGQAIIGETPPEGQQESVGALAKRTAVEAAFQHTYVAQAVQQNLMLAFQNVHQRIASISPTDMNHMLCSLLSSLTELATPSSPTSAPLERSEADQKKSQAEAKEQMLQVLLNLCLPEGPASLDVGEGLKNMGPVLYEGGTIDIQREIQKYIYNQLKASLNSVADRLIATLFSDETRDKLVLSTMEAFHSAVGSPLASPPAASLPSTSPENTPPSLFEGFFRSEQDIPEGERFSESERTAEVEALVTPLKGFVEAIIPQIIPPKIRALVFKQMPPEEMARTIAAPCVRYMESIDLKRLLANAVLTLPGYITETVESGSQASPQLPSSEEGIERKKAEEERATTKARLEQLCGEEGVQALAQGIGKTSSQYLQDYMKKSPGIGMKILRFFDSLFGHCITLLIGAIVRKVLNSSWKPEHLQVITDVMGRAIQSGKVTSWTIESLKPKPVRVLPSSTAG